MNSKLNTRAKSLAVKVKWKSTSNSKLQKREFSPWSEKLKVSLEKQSLEGDVLTV